MEVNANDLLYFENPDIDKVPFDTWKNIDNPSDLSNNKDIPDSFLKQFS